MERKAIHIIKVFAFIALFLPAWFGCSSDMEEVIPGTSETSGNYDGEPILIKAKVSAIQEFTSGVITRANLARQINVEPLDKTKDSGFDFVTTVKPISTAQTRANVNVTDTRFRIVAYKNNAISVANFAGYGDYQIVGGVTSVLAGYELSIPAGTYLFVCYSYGEETTDMPVFDPSVINVPVNQTQDFMIYTKSNVNVVPGNDGTFTVDNIQFARQCSQVSIEVIAEGFGDDAIKACKATLSNLNDNVVNWPLAGGMLPLTGTSGSVSYTWNTLNKDTIVSDKSIVLPLSPRNLTVTFTELEIGEYTFNDPTVTLANCEFVAAGNYKLSIKVTRNYIEAGGYKWAKGNLYKEGNEYKFEATQEAYHSGATGGSFFVWNELSSDIVSGNAGEYSYDKDPCSKVAPAGTWQTPSRNETLGFQGNYVWDDTKKGAWLGGSNKLFLPAIGIRFGNNGQEVELGGVLSNYALRDFVAAPACWTLSIFNTQDINWNDALLRDYGYPIRCVKKSNM